MFSLARSVVRHKIGVIAVIAFAVVMFSNSGDDEKAAKSSSPWSNQPAEVASSGSSKDDGSLTAKLGDVAASASELAAEKILGDKELSPVKLGDEAVDNFNGANEAFAKANSGE